MDLHRQIMNLRAGLAPDTTAEEAYKLGHRDARHAAAELASEHSVTRNKLREALALIAALDPEHDSPDGFNEWGEADCFNKAQAIAREALVLHNVRAKPDTTAEKNDEH